jgi:hypothetical protein
VPFTVVDLDGDGRISESEFREWSSARGGSNAVGMTPADRFRAIDKNHDGVISPEEWKAGAYSRTPFSAVDANKDGTISLREFTAWGPAASRTCGACAASRDHRARHERAHAQPRAWRCGGRVSSGATRAAHGARSDTAVPRYDDDSIWRNPG